MTCLGNKWRSLCHFWDCTQVLHDSFIDYDGYSISSKVFLPTVVGIMVIWIKFTHWSILVHWFLNCQCLGMFSLAFSCLTTFNLLWSMDLRFQVPMQYCSLQHWTLLPSPVTSTTGCCFCFGSVFSFFLELFLYFSPVAYWAPTNLGSSSFSVLSFFLFMLFIGFSRQEYWSGLPFTSPVDHVLSELSTMTHLSWVALQGMAHSFIELNKAVVHVISLTSFLWLWFSFYLPSDNKDKRLREFSWWERLTEGETHLILMGWPCSVNL